MRTPWPRGRRTRLCHKHARPYHPQTCGKFERFHQTLKKYLAKQPAADSLEALQAQLDRFVLYNESRPHRALGWRTPREVFDAKIKARPQGATPATHFRVRHAQVDRHGKVTLRYDSKLFHIGLGARHKGLPVVLLVANRDVRVVSADGELLRHLTLDPDRTNCGGDPSLLSISTPKRSAQKGARRSGFGQSICTHPTRPMA